MTGISNHYKGGGTAENGTPVSPQDLTSCKTLTNGKAHRKLAPLITTKELQSLNLRRVGPSQKSVPARSPKYARSCMESNRRSSMRSTCDYRFSKEYRVKAQHLCPTNPRQGPRATCCASYGKMVWTKIGAKVSEPCVDGDMKRRGVHTVSLPDGTTILVCRAYVNV